MSPEDRRRRRAAGAAYERARRPSRVERHPAETTSAAAGAIVAIAALIFDVELDPAEVAVAVGVVGSIAAAVTAWITRIRDR